MADNFVSINMLGICEHCGVLINMQEMGVAATIAGVCPNLQCGEKLFEASFGLEGDTLVRWVGPEGTWLSVQPTQEFQLGEWTVMVGTKLHA